jgi:hypothetical protein
MIVIKCICMKWCRDLIDVSKKINATQSEYFRAMDSLTNPSPNSFAGPKLIQSFSVNTITAIKS